MHLSVPWGRVYLLDLNGEGSLRRSGGLFHVPLGKRMEQVRSLSSQANPWNVWDHPSHSWLLFPYTRASTHPQIYALRSYGPQCNCNGTLHANAMNVTAWCDLPESGIR